MLLHSYTKGVNFVGSVIKKDRLYVANRTVSNIYSAIDRYNDDCEDLQHILQSLNSYFGFLKHYLTFNIKCKIYSKISNELLQKITLDTKFQKFILL